MFLSFNYDHQWLKPGRIGNVGGSTSLTRSVKPREARRSFDLAILAHSAIISSIICHYSKLASQALPFLLDIIIYFHRKAMDFLCYRATITPLEACVPHISYICFLVTTRIMSEGLFYLILSSHGGNVILSSRSVYLLTDLVAISSRSDHLVESNHRYHCPWDIEVLPWRPDWERALHAIWPSSMSAGDTPSIKPYWSHSSMAKHVIQFGIFGRGIASHCGRVHRVPPFILARTLELGSYKPANSKT